MSCKWLICLEFSPRGRSRRLGAGQKTASLCREQPCWKVDAHVGNTAKRRVPGTSQADCTTDKSTFCDTTTEIPCMQPNGLPADPAEIKSLNRQPSNDNVNQSDLPVPAAPFGIALWQKSACAPCTTCASSYFFSSRHPFDPFSLHPRAYAQTPSLTDFSVGQGASKALRQFPTFAQRPLWHRWPIFGL